MIAVQPVPIFINNTREIECIVQDGKKYCERQDLTPQQIGFVILFFLLVIVWAGFFMWLAFSKDQMLLAAFVFFGPLLLIALLLILR